ncbi:TVP38/TMEM64 family protein [Lacticaseibacillus thailandensis]|uniref:TVP38/TMEM64 family membrane protein n=1 Tax=Lacticaseibacillus thailandensis DSM 22698 = JCM 13996 TaxID=1423810 RepID=A0A0R2C7B3_9LACO|nr:TVP38/TMEM64 family protein [Lacticaseibacillus thailandensis]KRM87431.1 hypothetical protein FD19_GL000935 [Lacticaseibacillus thailandensis DSM 22698 = JCM 13996]
MESSTKVQRVSQLCGLAVIITLAIICYRFGILSSVERIQALVHTAGIWGPILFIGLQIIQVTFPIIPGGMTTVAAVSIFGPFWGFVYNYVGVGLGSVIAFLIVRQVGQPFIHAVIPPKFVHKYEHYLDNQPRFDRLFAIAILLPVAPDDFLCMLAGLTKMSLRKFVWIIVLCKPWTILAYSMGMNKLIMLMIQHF